MILVLLACTDPAGDSDSKVVVTSDVTWEAQAVPSVYRVHWTTPSAATGRIEYGTDGAFDHTVVATTDESGTDHSALLAGLGAGETWSLRAVTEMDGTDTEEGTVELDIPAAPDRVTPTTPTDELPDRGGFTIVALPMEEDNYVAIVDRAGRPTWWYHLPVDGVVLDARLTNDGAAVDCLITGETSVFYRINLDGTQELEVPSGTVHHAFMPLPTGGYYAMVHDERTVDGVRVIGDAIANFDESFTEGDTVWTAWDHFDAPDVTDVVEALDWTHSNDLHYVEASDKVLVSFYGLDAIVQVDVASGVADWQFGGEGADIAVDAEDPFDSQHGIRDFENGVAMFDNGVIPPEGIAYARSSVRTYELSGDHSILTRKWEEPDGLYAVTLGNADPDEDGILTVGWGSGGRLTELDTSEKTMFIQKYRLDFPLGSPFGYVHRITDLAGATF